MLALNYWTTYFPGSILASIGVLILTWKAIVWFVTSTQTLKQVKLSLPVIEAEFSPNSGGSMRDRVDALHDAQGELAARFRGHVADDQRSFNKLQAVLDRIEDKL
jgi:hypothetical protein